MSSGRRRLGSWFKHPPKSTEWPQEFMCPISKSPMADPVIVCSGQTYERRCIEAWMKLGQRECYVTGTDLVNSTVIANVALKTAILHWCQGVGIPKPNPPDHETAKNCALKLINKENGVKSVTHCGDSPPSEIGYFSKSAKSDATFPVSENGCSYISDPNSHTVPPGSNTGNATLARNVSEPNSPPSVETPNTRATDNLSSDFRNLSVAPMVRYAHSATQVNVLRTGSDSSSSEDIYVPLPLATKPSSYLSQPQEIEEVNDPSSSTHTDSELVSEFGTRMRLSRALEQEEAATDLRKLTRTNRDSRISLCHPKLLSALMPLLTSRYSGVQINAVAALVNLSLEKENKVGIVRAGAIPYLIDVLKGGHPEAQEHAAGGIFSLALNDENKIVIGVLGAIPPLIHILRTGGEKAREDAAMALYHLSFAASNQSKLVKVGAVGILIGFAQDEKSRVSSRALMILCNIATISEGRKALLDANAIASLVSILSKRQKDRSRGSQEILEQTVAVLLLLSRNNLRFVSLAIQAGAMEPLIWLAENGSARAKEKSSALLSMMREVSTDDEECPDSILPRSHPGRLVRGALHGPNSTAF
eukprot:Gb_13006 [translate_table: standard]